MRAAVTSVGVVAVLAVLLSGCGSPPAARRAIGPHAAKHGRLTAQEYAAAVALIGTFPHIVTTGHPVDDSAADEDFTVHAVMLTAHVRDWGP